LDEANKKAIIGIGAAIAIGSVATVIAYMTTETQNYVVKVDGTRVTQEEFDKGVEAAKGSPMGSMQTPDMLKHGVVGQLVDRQLVQNESAKRGLTMPDKDMQAKIDEIKRPYGDDDRFAKVLESNHMSLNELKDRIRFGYLIDALGKDIQKGKAITDVEVKTYYDQHPQAFKTDEEVRASHILVKDEAKAKELLAQLKGGADFAVLAKANSQDGSKEQGGDLGFFKRGKMVAEFETAAFGLQPGQLSSVVKTQFGYHIIKVTDRHPANTRPFTEVEKEARDRLTKDREREGLEKWLTEARTKAHVEYKTGYEPPPTPKPMPSPVASGQPQPVQSGAPAPAMSVAPASTPIPTAPASSGGTPDNSTKGHAPTPGPSH
jgi:parvulin-like peptidyl-prolyl isomerase